MAALVYHGNSRNMIPGRIEAAGKIDKDVALFGPLLMTAVHGDRYETVRPEYGKASLYRFKSRIGFCGYITAAARQIAQIEHYDAGPFRNVVRYTAVGVVYENYGA